MAVIAHLTQRHLHEDIGTAIGHGRKTLRLNVAKGNRFVQVNSVLKARIAAKKQRLGVEASGLRNGVLKQTAADTSAAQMRRNRHLGKLVDSIAHGDQRDASYGFSRGVGHEDMTALQKELS